jgi:uncharacterized protein YaaN involved in tellurite resistance
MGPEYLAILITTAVAAISGGTWTANKLLSRSHERIKQISERMQSHETKVNSIEDQFNRMPLDYVLKVDFLREIQQMHDNFKQINSKLDKMMERLLR